MNKMNPQYDVVAADTSDDIRTFTYEPEGTGHCQTMKFDIYFDMVFN